MIFKGYMYVSNECDHEIVIIVKFVICEMSGRIVVITLQW